jgi:redox-sensitive bicupin YhaK (pirin superfamily)
MPCCAGGFAAPLQERAGSLTGMMPIQFVRDAKTAYPTGDPSFAVKQCFPAAVGQEESDPFLMCDEFGPTPSKGAHGDDSDEGFDVPWHPHHGMDILSYIVEGRGRHADSMGNRESFDSPGFQWISVGSGIEHAEGGGTPLGQRTHGFQIWMRMPVERMENDPEYGVVNPDEIPVVPLEKGQVRVISGAVDDVAGPARFAVTAQILDVELEAGAEWVYMCPEEMDNAMFYAFKGSAVLNGGTKLGARQVCRFDTSGPRAASVVAGDEGFRMMVFTGKMTKEDIVWHGPFVCSSRANLRSCFTKFQTGELPSKRADWDYKRISKKPK